MKSRIPVGVVMMLVAMVFSVLPAATITAIPAAALSTCDWAQFVADKTVPDGTSYAPGATFDKTWTIKNIGTCTWNESYALVFSSGDRMGGPTSVNLPKGSSVPPGQSIDLTLKSLTAPSSAGHYIGYWMLKNTNGALFGIGVNANKAWWVDIIVTGGSTAPGVAYDFAANYCSATWYSLSGNLPCPGTDGAAAGFVLRVDKPQLEDGTTASGQGLITNPQNGFNGDIHGSYPSFRVQAGDRFDSIVNCAHDATSCYVTFRLDYQVGNGPIFTYWTFRERYEGLYYHVTRDLTPLAGLDVKFILTVLATGSATGDRALWSNPVILRSGATPPPVTVTPVTPGPTTSCDRAAFLADVTVPDGTTYAPGATFTKTWRLKNVGTCTWTTDYKMVFDSGEQMGGPSSVPMPYSVAPGNNVDISVNLTAPNVARSYRGFWRFQNANGARFGLGSAGNISWWVDIRVSGSSPSGTNQYDFGTASSPVAAGYNRVTETTAYSASTGYGWKDTSTLESRDRSGPDDLRRDFVMSSSAARVFQVDLPNPGTYTVIVTMGDQQFAHDKMVVKANGQVRVASFDTAAGSFAVNTFGVTVNSGSLQLEFSDAGGTDPTWVVNGLVISRVVPLPSGADRAQFVTDVNYPDGTIVAPGSTFTKTWRIKNVGTSTWTTSYALVFDTGDLMGAQFPVYLPNSVAPGNTVDLSVNLSAPLIGGSYRGFWKLQNADGAKFGIGSNATSSWWVAVTVAGPTQTPGTPPPTSTPQAGVQYDFAANACSGVWYSGAGQLPCPGSDGDQKGFVLKIPNPTLENGTVDSRLGLLTFPQNIWRGYIQGFFPPYHVKTGDRFRSIINCSYGATACNVSFRLDYKVGNGGITTLFGPFGEKYEGNFYQMDVPLTSLVGQDVTFILTVVANSYATGDRALWVGPVIYNNTGLTPTATGTPPSPTATSPTPTGTPPSPTATVPSSTPTLTSTPTVTPTATAVDTTGWITFQNAKYGFHFKVPAASVVESNTDNAGKVQLPFTTGTDLNGKWIEVAIVEGANPCKAANSDPNAVTSNVTYNNVQFLKQGWTEGAAGSFYDITAFSTQKQPNNACITVKFVLRRVDTGALPTPTPPPYNQAAETAIFPSIMSTYGNQ